VKHRGWIVGSFIDDSFDVRLTSAVEIKWSVHRAGNERPSWAEDNVRTTALLLVSGCFRLNLPDRSVLLTAPGDYVVWGAGNRHRWRAEEDSVTLTVRWPSLPVRAVAEQVGGR
jgi:hypothetical protein